MGVIWKQKFLMHKKSDMYPQYWTPSIGGICIMKYSYEYKQRLSKNSVKKDAL